MSAFTIQLKVRFGDVDPAGIVYFPRIFDYVHEAFEEVWEVHVGARYYQLLLEQKIGFPLVSSHVDFRSPLRFGDRPLVRVTCFRLGRSSIGLRYQFTVDDRLCVDARMTVACVRLETMESLPIPDAHRARFEEIREDLQEGAEA